MKKQFKSIVYTIFISRGVFELLWNNFCGTVSVLIIQTSFSVWPDWKSYHENKINQFRLISHTIFNVDYSEFELFMEYHFDSFR